MFKVIVSLFAMCVSVIPVIVGSTELNPYFSNVEKMFLENSERKTSYEGENIAVIETDNICCLGKLTALRFIEWVQENPEGVIALPTGKTPELFIEYLKHYKENWKQSSVQKDLQSYGIHSTEFPATRNLKFVQLDEFFPIDVKQKNSFTYYIDRYYTNLLEIAPQNILSLDFASVGILQEKGVDVVFPGGRVDLTLLGQREPKNQKEIWQKQALQEAQALCHAYEMRIKNWGGIGFFLGGIGPDGHIAFNMEGSDHTSKTRLVHLNYKTAAAAASNLGGIEYSRDKTAVTIGLGTITFNPAATWIIMAAGEAKARVVADAVEKHKSRRYPATVLQGFRGARFYVTKGASSQLEARRVEDVQKQDYLNKDLVDDIVIELALKQRKSLDQLNVSDFQKQKRARVLFNKYSDRVADFAPQVKKRLIAKIEKGLEIPKSENILHTSPHHDDVMLSYHLLLKPLIQHNTNHFVYLTSGFNSVTDSFITTILNRINLYDIEKKKEDIFQKSYQDSIKSYTKAALINDQQQMGKIEELIMLKQIAQVYNAKSASELSSVIADLSRNYFPKKNAGEKDDEKVQLLKGTMRESECDRMLALCGVHLSDITHMRSKFYTGDYFNPMPTIEKDARTLKGLYDNVKPTVITVAFDPEGTGPDTHYKVLQVVAEALRLKGSKMSPKIWGYRNVWYRFTPSEATTFVPVSQDEMNDLNQSFMCCFSTQKSASFPSPYYDGPFSGYAKQVQKEQMTQLKYLLGPDFFTNHKNKRIREAQGFVFIKEMGCDEFLDQAKMLKSRIEN